MERGKGASKGKEKVDAIATDGGGSSSGKKASVAEKTSVVTIDGRRIELQGPIEQTWSHGSRWGNGWKCGYCPASNKGGGATRLREHLCGLQGQVAPCSKAPRIVKDALLNQVALVRQKRRNTNEGRLWLEKALMEHHYEMAIASLDEEGQYKMAVQESLKEFAMGGNSPPFGRASMSGTSSGSGLKFGKTSGSGSKAASCSGSQSKLESFYKHNSKSSFDIDLARSMGPSQPRVDVMLAGGAKEKLGKALSKWFHANDIPGRKADCPYFRSFIKLAQQLGDVPIPSGREIDGKYLHMNYEEMMTTMAQFREDWEQYGVTIMCDSWTGPTMMCIINFMIFCNGRMFFHKSIDATGEIQSAEFIFKALREVVVDEIGANFVVQMVTDNGSDYKKACKQLVEKYPHITCQPCAAHTINLMLKDIARFIEVVDVVDSAKRICRFLYNHNRLHATMKKKIGGELIRWNATRFGTVFLFLQSFWDKQDKFKAWMVSPEWSNSDWKDEEDHAFTYDRLTDRRWWNRMELVLKIVTPIFVVLRFADQQKNGTISGFLPKMLCAADKIRASLERKEDLLENTMEVINRRLRYLLNDTLMVAAATLDPEALYRTNIVQTPIAKFVVTMALKKVASTPQKASRAIEEFAFFSAKRGLFGGEEARCSALAGRMSAADWWGSYGGQCRELQQLAIRIVSQCMSSSGCERNWSTFALIHTKLRNKLGYDKLHELVFVHYNLKLRIQQFKADFKTFQEMDADPYSMMMNVTLFDESNPIMDWL